MTTTETRPRSIGALAAARRERDRALDRAEQDGATVVRIEHVRAIVGATPAELGGCGVSLCIHGGAMRCWTCLLMQCEGDPPSLHPWADQDDIDHAAATGQPEPTGWCGCVFCGEPAVRRAEEPRT